MLTAHKPTTFESTSVESTNKPANCHTMVLARSAAEDRLVWLSVQQSRLAMGPEPFLPSIALTFSS